MTTHYSFFLDKKASVIQYELIQISHPSFSQTYYLVRNAINGLTVTLETAAEQAFTYLPMKITRTASLQNLDYGIEINLGDLGEVIPVELDAIATAGTYNVKPVVIYRTYSGDDLTVPLFGPITLEITSFAFNKESSSFIARPPIANINGTGQVYDYERFPMLRGFS